MHPTRGQAIPRLVRVDPQSDLGADRRPHGGHCVDVAPMVDPDLHIEDIEAPLPKTDRVLRQVLGREALQESEPVDAIVDTATQ